MKKSIVLILMLIFSAFPVCASYNTYNTVEEVTIYIGGMKDYTDRGYVYDTLVAMEGVVYVEVELSPPEAVVQYNYMNVHLDDLLYAIQNLGFTASVR